MLYSLVFKTIKHIMIICIIIDFIIYMYLHKYNKNNNYSILFKQKLKILYVKLRVMRVKRK